MNSDNLFFNETEDVQKHARFYCVFDTERENREPEQTLENQETNLKTKTVFQFHDKYYLKFYYIFTLFHYALF